MPLNMKQRLIKDGRVSHGIQEGDGGGWGVESGQFYGRGLKGLENALVSRKPLRYLIVPHSQIYKS